MIIGKVRGGGGEPVEIAVDDRDVDVGHAGENPGVLRAPVAVADYRDLERPGPVGSGAVAVAVSLLGVHLELA